MNELPDSNADEARRLVANVFEDLAGLRAVVRDADTPGRLGCFLAHLVVEKALKSSLVACEVPFPKTHNLLQLQGLRASTGRLGGIDMDILRALNPWAVDGRYADDQREATRAEAARFEAFATAVVETVRSEIERL